MSISQIFPFSEIRLIAYKCLSNAINVWVVVGNNVCLYNNDSNLYYF